MFYFYVDLKDLCLLFYHILCAIRVSGYLFVARLNDEPNLKKKLQLKHGVLFIFVNQ